MSTKINVRSPFYVKVATTPLVSVALDLYIWDGATGARPASAQYSFTKTEVADNNYVVFEISEFVKDYLVTEYGNYSTNAVWVQWSATVDAGSPTFSPEHIGVDGFGYFEDGINPQGSTHLLQDNTTIYYNDGSDIVIPIWTEDLSTITLQSSAGADINWEAAEDFWNTYDVSWGYSVTPIVITDSGNSNQKIQYIIIADSELLTDGDTVTITSGVGGATTVVNLKKICEPKYTPMNVIFYNKYGALQNMWFFKKNITSINTSSESYKSNVLDFANLTYSTTSPQVKTFNKNGKEAIKLNSGFYIEEYSEVVRQLLLSEEVWVDNGTNVLPVRLNTSSYTFKTSVNDKLINHSFDFEYAFDKINSIR